MKKKVLILLALVFALSMVLAACGSSQTAAPSENESSTSETADTAAKQTAAGILITNDEVVADAVIDISDGYSVAFDWNGISLIEGEYSELAWPLVSIVALADGSYDLYIEQNKDNETYQETDGVIKFVSSIEELNYMFMLDDKVPILISFEKGVDEARAEEIMAGIKLTVRE